MFLLPFGRPRGLLGVGTSLGSFCKDRWGHQEHKSPVFPLSKHMTVSPDPSKTESARQCPDPEIHRHQSRQALVIQVLTLTIFFCKAPPKPPCTNRRARMQKRERRHRGTKTPSGSSATTGLEALGQEAGCPGLGFLNRK